MYIIKFEKRAIKELEKLPKKEARKIINGISLLADDLKGDVKKLTDYSPEYRLRIASYRILFEINENIITIYKVKHRKDAYK